MAFDLPNRTVTVLGTRSKKITAEIEDILPALRSDEPATAVLDAINERDRNLDDAVH